MEDELSKVVYETEDQSSKQAMLQATADKMKEKILKLKEKNTHDQTTYLSEYDRLQVTNRFEYNKYLIFY